MRAWLFYIAKPDLKPLGLYRSQGLGEAALERRCARDIMKAELAAADDDQKLRPSSVDQSDLRLVEIELPND